MESFKISCLIDIYRHMSPISFFLLLVNRTGGNFTTRIEQPPPVDPKEDRKVRQVRENRKKVFYF